MPLNVVKVPPINIFPSGCRAIVFTTLFALVPPLLNVASIVPVAEMRAILLTVVPAYSVKLPPAIILPLVCTATSVTMPLVKPVPGANETSSVPLLFILAIRARAVPAYVVNAPPM